MSKNHWQQIVSGGLAFSLAVACAEQARTVQAPSSNGSTDNCEPPFTRYDESLGKIIGNIVQSDASKFIESHPVETGGKEVYGYCLGDTNTYWVVDSQEGTVDIFVEVGEGRVNKLAGKSIGSGEITDSVWFYTDENGNPTNSQALSIDLPQGSNKDIFINLTNPDGSSTNEDIFIVTPNFELASKVNLKPISITSVDGSELILTPTPPPPGLTVTETLAPTATPEATAAAEIGEFTPANDIVLTENLSNYDFKLASDADKKAIFLDTIHNQVAWATSKSKGFESNRAIYEAIVVEHPEWEGIGLGSDYNTVVAFMTEFLTRSGGKMIVADASFNKFTANFNLPIKFEVIQVNEFPKGYSRYIANTDKSGPGGGGSVYVDENGQYVYSIAILPGAIERTQTEPQSLYKAWNWTPAEVISDLFRQTISELVYKNRYSDEMKYQLYTRGGVPSNENFFSDVYWTFLKDK